MQARQSRRLLLDKLDKRAYAIKNSTRRGGDDFNPLGGNIESVTFWMRIHARVDAQKYAALGLFSQRCPRASHSRLRCFAQPVRSRLAVNNGFWQARQQRKVARP